MQPFRDLFDSTQFSTGVGLGALALLVTLAVVLGLSTLFAKRARPPGLVGPVFVAATVLALDASLGGNMVWDVPTKVAAGLAILWIAGAVAGLTPVPWLIGPLAAIPGALLLADANAGLDARWVQALIVVGTVVIGTTAADFDRRTARYGLAPLLLFAAVGGIYLTVPDTEIMRCVVGVALPLVLLAWPFVAASLGAGGAYAAVGLLLWIVPIEGIGRAGSIVGSVAAFALLVGEPIGRALFGLLGERIGHPQVRVRYPRTMVVAAQVVLVLYASRVAGVVSSASTAFVLTVPVYVAAIAFGLLFEIPDRPSAAVEGETGFGQVRVAP